MRRKRSFKTKQKAFFIIFKGLSLKQVKQILLEGENPTLRLEQTNSTFHPKFLNHVRTSIQHQPSNIHGILVAFIHKFLFTNSMYNFKLNMEAEHLMLILLPELLESDDKKIYSRKNQIVDKPEKC